MKEDIKAFVSRAVPKTTENFEVNEKVRCVLGTEVVDCEINKVNESTVIVKLPNGSFIKRHKDKQQVFKIK
jgi:hypothetical protein